MTKDEQWAAWVRLAREEEETWPKQNYSVPLYDEDGFGSLTVTIPRMPDGYDLEEARRTISPLIGAGFVQVEELKRRFYWTGRV